MLSRPQRGSTANAFMTSFSRCRPSSRRSRTDLHSNAPAKVNFVVWQTVGAECTVDRLGARLRAPGCSSTPWRPRQSRLVAPTEDLQERRRLSILHRPVLCSGVLYGRDLCPCIFLPMNLFSRILHGR